MIQIFIKVGTIDLLFNAQRVCSYWREIAKDPELYRVIDFYNPWKYFESNFDSIESAAKLAIDRSHGGLVEFSIECFCTNTILYEIVDKAPKLTCLRIADCELDFNYHLIEVIEKLPLLEEVEFILPYFWDKLLEAVGRSCTKLRSLRLIDEDAEEEFFGEWFNNKAFAIAGNLNPALHSLHLLGSSTKNNGLEAILERFTQLEYFGSSTTVAYS